MEKQSPQNDYNNKHCFYFYFYCIIIYLYIILSNIYDCSQLSTTYSM